MNKKKVIISIIVVLVLALGTGIFLKMRGGTKTDDGVYVISVSDFMGTSTSTTRYAGIVEAEKTVDYKQNGDQTIEEIYVEEGQEVSVDQPLFKYNVTDTQNKITSTSIDIEELNANNQALQNEITEIRNAGGDPLEVTTMIQSKQLEIRKNNYAVQSKQAELQQLQVQVNNAVVKSSLNGTVKAVNRPEEETDTSKPVISITQSGDFKVTGKVDETNISSIVVGQSVIVRSRMDETKTWNGSITAIQTEPQSQQDNNMYMQDSGERASVYPFTVALNETDGLMLGQHVYIEPDFGNVVHTEGIWLDPYLVNYDEEDNAFIWKAKGNRIVKQMVQLGETDDMGMMEITEGLSKEDEIAYPDETIKEGDNVIRMEDMQ